MNITNNNNLPAPIYQAILANPYSRGSSDISVTDLIESPRLVALREANADNIEQDASGLIWSLMGQAMHTVLERAGIASGKGETEARLYTEVENWIVSGQFDYIDENNVLWDWKLISTYEYTNGVKESREKQLNLYATLARRNGLHISGLRVGFIFIDYSPRAAATQKDYPPAQAVEIEIPLWSEEEGEAYLRERVLVHQEAQYEEIPECTEEERWAKPETWAVMKRGTKKAIRVFKSRDDADALHTALSTTPSSHYIQHRPGEPTRCKYYCPVLRFCTQGLGLVNDTN